MAIGARLPNGTHRFPCSLEVQAIRCGTECATILPQASRRVNVLQVLPELNSGGVERGTLELGRHLVASGHQSLVVSHGGRLVNRLEAEGSRHITMPVHRKSLASLRQVRPFRDLLEREKPDILHLRSRVPAWIGWLAWRKMDPPTRPHLVTTVHGFYSVNAYSKIMTSGERVICVSNAIRDYVTTNYPGVPEEKLRVVHRGVDPAEFPWGSKPPDEWRHTWEEAHPELADRFVVLLPGRVTRWKGHEDFLQVVRVLKDRLPSAHALIAGGPHPRKKAFDEEIRAKAKDLGLDACLTFLGHRDDLKEVMAVSDVIVSLSTDPEAFGRVTLEALTLGKPVAGYHHGGVGEQLDALLPEGAIPVGDHGAMADLLVRWANDGAPQPAKPGPFALAETTRKITAVYEELLAERSPSA